MTLSAPSPIPPHEVLNRLRTDVPAHEVPTEKPPVPHIGGLFQLRVADASEGSRDAELVAQWMSRLHLVETWEQPWEAPRWRQDWDAKLGTTYSVPLIPSYETDGQDGQFRDVGYVEIYRPHLDEVAHTYQSRPTDLGFQIAVGEPDLTGKGLFSPFMRSLAESLLAEDPECDLVIVEPDYRNEQMHRALRKVGWTDICERQQRVDRRVRLYFYPGPDSDVSQRGQES